MNFRIRGLDARQFDHLFALSDVELAKHGAEVKRRILSGANAALLVLAVWRCLLVVSLTGLALVALALPTRTRATS
jgi:hypothetical protein